MNEARSRQPPGSARLLLLGAADFTLCTGPSPFGARVPTGKCGWSGLLGSPGIWCPCRACFAAAVVTTHACSLSPDFQPGDSISGMILSSVKLGFGCRHRK
jgi:hypothetical protein